MRRRDLVKLSGLGATLAFLSHQIYQSTLLDNQNSIDTNSLLTSLKANQKSLTSQIKVNWDSSIADSNPFVFGSNDYEITRPEVANDSTFQNLLGELNIPLVRIHHSELSDRWTDTATKSWDEAKIKAGYDASYPHNPTIVQNIPRWPKWMKTDGHKKVLAASEHSNYATFCAELVNIINQRQQRQVIYWEPFNEVEKHYEKAGKLDQLWQLYNQTAEAMKARDQTIKVGGPVLTWDNKKILAQFLQNCSSNVDFISWHRYGTGNAEESTDKLMSRTSMYKKQVSKFRSVASKYIQDRKIPLFLSEYNINYSWKSGEMRQNTHIGAVWFASVLKHLVEVGIDMAASWHLKNNIYGMIDRQNNLRPAATVFAWGNKYLTGTVAETESDNSWVEALAVSQKLDKRSLLLINKSSASAQVNLQITPRTLSEQKVEAVTLGENGIDNIADALGLIKAQSLTISPYSLILFKFSN